MTCTELRRALKSSATSARVQLRELLSTLENIKDTLIETRDDCDCDLPEAVGEGRAEKAEEDWFAYQEICNKAEETYDQIETLIDDLISDITNTW